MELPRGVNNTERTRICATECIGECVSSIRIGCRDGSTDVCVGCGVLSNSARGACAISKDRGGVREGFIYLRDVDGDRNAGAAIIAIISGYGYGISRLGLIV